MARSTRSRSSEQEDDTQDDEIESKPTRGPQPPRMSVSVTTELRKKIRIAAARADLEIGEWCKLIVAEAARRRVKKLYPDDDV